MGKLLPRRVLGRDNEVAAEPCEGGHKEGGVDQTPSTSCPFQNSTRSTVDTAAAIIAKTGHTAIRPGTPQKP